MMTKPLRKIYVIGSETYSNWMQGICVDDMAAADVVVFTGGEDVTPALYKSVANPHTACNPRRDEVEKTLFNEALGLKKPMVGICRGAQFLCVMAGGRLVQHQDNAFMHGMSTYDQQHFIVNSTHHQAQYPWGLKPEEFRVLGWSKKVSLFHESGDQKEMVVGVVKGDMEVEVCHYPKIRALGIQSHPEMQYGQSNWSSETMKTIKFYQNLLTLHLTTFPNAK